MLINNKIKIALASFILCSCDTFKGNSHFFSDNPENKKSIELPGIGQIPSMSSVDELNDMIKNGEYIKAGLAGAYNLSFLAVFAAYFAINNIANGKRGLAILRALLVERHINKALHYFEESNPKCVEDNENVINEKILKINLSSDQKSKFLSLFELNNKCTYNPCNYVLIKQLITQLRNPGSGLDQSIQILLNNFKFDLYTSVSRYGIEDAYQGRAETRRLNVTHIIQGFLNRSGDAAADLDAGPARSRSLAGVLPLPPRARGSASSGSSAIGPVAAAADPSLWS